ncbi:MAG: LPS-assembly protein LptD [Burkholderiales bacterium]|nr:MAG: LPS-assembly protein LptD [Burkholderiales bacterium]
MAVLLVGMGTGAAFAQEAGAPVRLQASPLLQEQLPPDVLDRLPVFVRGQTIEGQADGAIAVEGQAELRRHDTVIRADRLEYDRRDGQTRATGDVLINRSGDRIQGSSLELNIETQQGSLEQPQFQLLRNEAKGDASRLEFLEKDRFRVHDARFSTCPRPPGEAWKPEWLVRASRIDLDEAQDVGTAVGAVVEFQGVPILAAPYLSFPLSDRRKSGWLPPSIGVDSQSGLELTVPYYLNLAPNFDATLQPTIMTKRGIDLGAEFRYLQPDYSGMLRASWTPDDRLREDDRWSYAFEHRQDLPGLMGVRSPVRLDLGLNRVSDSNFWRDYPRALTSLTSRLLESRASLGWNQGPWSLSLGANAWQTLQDPDSVITPPYDRLPTLGMMYRREDQTIAGSRGWDWSVQGEWTRFRRSAFAAGSSAEEGDRTLLVGEITRRWGTHGWYVQPRLRLHAAHYRYADDSGRTVSDARLLPTFSTDSGLVFERQARFFGRDVLQTLEPRLFFTWTPFRDQSGLPNYDASNLDFNFASIFTEHTIGGNDRIDDARALTLGVESRIFDPGSGMELARIGLAQRYLLADQQVTLDDVPVTDRFSDILLGARVQWSPRWSTDLNLRYRPGDGSAIRTTLGARYMPGPYRVLSVAYRQQIDASEQVDIGWQWPLSDLFGRAPDPVRGKALGPGQWYGLGRMNYSVPDKKIVDLVAGFEYDAGCWIGRLVLERLQLDRVSANERVLLQLEFNGFSRLGASSLKTLSNQIPRYQYLREEINPPSRFQYHD